MKTLFDDEELQDQFPGGENTDQESDADFDHDYMTHNGINDEPDIEDADTDEIDDGLLNEDPYGDDDDEIDAEKDELDGPANDLVSQPDDDE